MSKISDDVKKIREISGAFRLSRILLTANNLGLFDFLDKYIYKTVWLLFTCTHPDRCTENVKNK